MAYPTSPVWTQARDVSINPAVFDEGSVSWTKQDWLRSLFYDQPSVMALGERRVPAGRFGYDFVLVVVLPNNELRHHLLQYDDLKYAVIAPLVRKLFQDLKSGEISFRWLDGSPEEDKMRAFVDRSTFGMGPASAEAQVVSGFIVLKHEVLAANREWMSKVFLHIPGVKSIVKSALTRRSPSTFAICFEDRHTWMKDPTFERIAARMKTPRHSRRDTPPYEIWVDGDVPFDRVGLEFVSTDFADAPDEQNEQNDLVKLPLHELAMKGRFILRVAAMQAGLLDTEQEKRMFMSLDNVHAAEVLYAHYHPGTKVEGKQYLCVLCSAEATHIHLRIARHADLGYNHYCDTCVMLPSSDIAARMKAKRQAVVDSVYAASEERIAQGYERRQPSKEERLKESEPHVVSGTSDDPKAGGCTTCGASFATNERFGTGDERLCGECEAKHDEADNMRQVHLEFVFKRRRLSVPKRSTRFDPRPGIDDVGLGGSGPNWED